MKKIYTIEGLDCANCALKVERGLNKDPNILSATIDFSTKRLYVTYKEEVYDFNKINEMVKSFDDDAFLLEPKKIKKEPLFTRELKILLIRIAISVVLFALALVFENIFNGKYYIYVPIYFISLIISIYDITWSAIQNIIHLRNPFDKNLLLTIAAVGSFCLVFLGHPSFMEGVMVIILSQIGEVFETIATNKSRNAIIEAIDLRSEKATLLNGDSLLEVESDTLKEGDIILVKVGEIVAVDGDIIEGYGEFDTSSLTGEFVPKSSKIGMSVLSGYILVSGSVKIRATKSYKDSAANKVLELVTSSGERKAKANRFIDKFAGIYTPIVFFVAVAFALIPPIILSLTGVNQITSALGETKPVWEYFLYSALSFIVIACPCAIVISVPLSFFSGIGLASKHGIVVKGANYFDKLCDVNTLITDKTGTLTYGTFKVNKEVYNDIDEYDFLEFLMAAECKSNHPIAKTVIGDSDVSYLIENVANYEEIAGYGVICDYHNNHLLVGNSKLLERENISFPNVEENGTIIYLCVNNIYRGYVVLGDEIKPGSFDLVNGLHKLNNEIFMFTGDSERIAKMTSENLHLDGYVASMLPDQKVKELEAKMGDKKVVAFVGDGINDAACIIRSDVGIAMGGLGSDLAVDNADLVIMNDNPKKILDAIFIAKCTRRKAIFNIVFALSIKLILMVLSSFGILGNMGMLVSVLADTGMTVLLVLNALLLLYKKVK